MAVSVCLILCVVRCSPPPPPSFLPFPCLTSQTSSKRRRQPKDIATLFRIPRAEAEELQDRLEKWRNALSEETGISQWHILNRAQVRVCVFVSAFSLPRLVID